MNSKGVLAACLFVSSVLVGVPSSPGSVAQAAATTTIDCDVPRAAGPTSIAPALESFDPQVPERIVETRIAEGGTGPVPAGCTLAIDMSGIGPMGVTAYALSVTTISPAIGYVTAFPCADGLPRTSSLNARVGVATPNLVVVAPDDDGRVCMFSLPGGELVVDVSGWWADGPNRFRPIEPVRVDDTRESIGVKLPANAIRAIDVAGVVVPDDAVSVSVNLAAVRTAGRGFLVVFPCGTPPPLASNVNYLADETRSVAAIVKLGESGAAKGKICVTADQDLHVVIDVTGYDSDTSGARPDLVLEPASDTRLVDTRDPALPGERFTRETTQRFDLSTVLERPDDAVGVLLNVVAVSAAEQAYVTVYPCTEERPLAASINHGTSATANLVVTALDAGADFCVFAKSDVDLVVDLVGVYTGREGSLLNEMTMRDPNGAVVPLDQPFTVDGSDYTIVCDGDRNLGLRLGLAPGVVASVNGVDVVRPSTAVDPDLAVLIEDEGLLTIEVERGSQVDAYHVRCLPTDFPRFRVETPEGARPVTPGWYVTEVGWNDPQAGHYLAIFDERGVPVWFKSAGQTLIDTKLLSSGNLVTSPITGTGFGTDAGRGHLVLDLDGSVVAERLSEVAGSPADHHDFVEIPSLVGNRRAIISYPRIDGADLSGLVLPAMTGCSTSVVGVGKTVVGGEILEIGGTTPTWTWNMSDHFGYDESTYAQCFGNFSTANGGAGEVDPFHINSIDRQSDGDYVVSARHTDSVFRVDRSSGEVDWILGTPPRDAAGDVVPNESGPRLTILGDPRNGPLRPHDARMTGDVVTMHDNSAGSGRPSRAVAYRVDAAAGTATMIWEIEHPEGRSNPTLGSVRVADDGTVLIGWGRVDPLFSEHTIDGTELSRWTRVNSSMAAYRIVKYPLGSFEVDELRDSAGGGVTGPVLKPGAIEPADAFVM